MGNENAQLKRTRREEAEGSGKDAPLHLMQGRQEGQKQPRRNMGTRKHEHGYVDPGV